MAYCFTLLGFPGKAENKKDVKMQAKAKQNLVKKQQRLPVEAVCVRAFEENSLNNRQRATVWSPRIGKTREALLESAVRSKALP